MRRTFCRKTDPGAKNNYSIPGESITVSQDFCRGFILTGRDGNTILAGREVDLREDRTFPLIWEKE